MKPSAIVSLFIAIAMIIAGFIICNIADAAARADGYDLHEGLFDENDNIVKYYSFSKADSKVVTKIDVELEDVDIEIVGGAPKSQITITNFLPATYACFINNKIVNITNKITLDTLVDSVNDIEFNGTRQFIDSRLFSIGRKKITIALDETSEDIKQIALTLTNCNLSVRDLSANLDLRLNAVGSQISISNCNTDASIYAECDKTNIKVENYDFSGSEFILNSSSLDFDSEIVVLYRVEIVSDGEVTVNGTKFMNLFKENQDYESYPKISVTATASEVTLDYLG